MQRTLKIYGYGFGNQVNQDQPAQIKIEIDDETMHEGAVWTPLIDDEFVPGSKEYPYYDSVAEWQQSFDAASKQLKITALTGNFCFMATMSDWMPIRVKNNPTVEWSSGPNRFIPCYARQEAEFVYFRDSNHDVMIDGVAQSREAHNAWENLGQWHWTIEQGQILTSTMMISAALETPVLDTKLPNPAWDPRLYLIWSLDHTI